MNARAAGPNFADLDHEIRAHIARHQAREFQRQEQQGLGRAIISAEFAGYRVIAVGRRMVYSKGWNTFHDFLRDYPRIVLGDPWWLDEVRKPDAERHRVVAWIMRASEQAAAARAAGRSEPGHLATGALSAYMRFAYDLYALQHSVEVEELLISRLKSPRGFPGAMHEVHVAASLLRAGFTLEMEDETDRRTTHVEFVATHTATGAKFSVEAKRREGAKLRINRLLGAALTKQAAHSRIVFIDTNDGRLNFHKFEKLPVALAEARQQLKLYSIDPVGQSLPPAYVVVSIATDEHHLDATDHPFGILLWGFHVDDMQPGLKTLMEQVTTRWQHAPVFDLLASIEKHRTIPASFDGEATAFARGAPPDRLQVGGRHMVPGPDGVDIEATLESGVVMPAQKLAWCTVRGVSDRQRFHCAIPLTDIEMEAYKQHPSTFFGVIDRNAGRKPLKSAMDHFEFLWESYKDTPKEKLLDFMKAAPEVGDLASLSQHALATHYCVRMAESMMRQLGARRPEAAAAAAPSEPIREDGAASV